MGSRWSLNDYLKDEKLTIHEKIKIAEIIFSKFSIMKEYLLDNRKLIFNTDKIYLDRNSMSIYMVYLPIEMENNLKIEDDLRELFEELFSDAGKYKNELSVVERKLITGLISKNGSLERIEKLFLDYEKLNSSESLEKRLYGLNKKSETNGEKILEETVCNEEKETIAEKEKVIKKITYASVIDENFDVFEDFGEEDLYSEADDDYIQYKEYKELQEYDKALNDSSKIRRLLKVQFYILVIFASIGVILGSDNRDIVIFIIVLTIILIIIFNISITKCFNEGEERYEEI